MSEKRGYLAGPIESVGDVRANLEAFHAAANRLRDKGWLIHNPAENFGGAANSRTAHQRLNLSILIRPSGAIGHGLELDAVLVLRGWEQSDGAKLEVAIAREIGLPVLDAETLEPVEQSVLLVVLSGRLDCVTVDDAEQDEIIKAVAEYRGEIAAVTGGSDARDIVSIFDEAKSVALKKNHDYGSSVFTPPVLSPALSADAAILVRMSDKINRLQTLMSGQCAQVADEAAADTMRDLGTYAFLWLIHHRRTALAATKQA